MGFEEFVKNELKLGWASKTHTHISESYKKSVEAFNEEIMPKLLKIVGNKGQARKAVKILLNRIEIEHKALTYEELDPVGAKSGVYDHHGYPSAYDLDTVAYTLAIGFKDKGALELVNNPGGLQQLIQSSKVEIFSR